MGKMDLSQAERDKAVRYMWSVIEECVDWVCEEVNTTHLAEDAIDNLAFIEYPESRKAMTEFDTQHDIWDLAADVGRQWEARRDHEHKEE